MGLVGRGQTTGGDSTAYKKRVLESTEVELLASYYTQDGSNAAVTGDWAPKNSAIWPLPSWSRSH